MSALTLARLAMGLVLLSIGNTPALRVPFDSRPETSSNSPSQSSKVRALCYLFKPYSKEDDRKSISKSRVFRGKENPLSLDDAQSVSDVVSSCDSSSGATGPLGIFEFVYLLMGGS